MQQAAHVLDAPNEEQCFLVTFVADNCLVLAYLPASQGGVFSLKSIPCYVWIDIKEKVAQIIQQMRQQVSLFKIPFAFLSKYSRHQLTFFPGFQQLPKMTGYICLTKLSHFHFSLLQRHMAPKIMPKQIQIQLNETWHIYIINQTLG